MASAQHKQWSVVAASTISFTVCFMVWMMFAVIGIPIKQSLGLNETQFGILVAMPVLTGSLIRLPLGMWTDRYGGRIVFFILMLSTVFPILFVASLPGRTGRPPTSQEADQPLQRMIESIKMGSFGSFIPFDRQGEPMQLS